MLRLEANPTFTAPVDIPIPGLGSKKTNFTFKHRTVDELAELNARHPGAPGFEYAKEIVLGWELSDPFNDANLRKLLQLYPGAATALMKGYIAELYGIRLGN